MAGEKNQAVLIYFLNCLYWTEIVISWMPASQKEKASINRNSVTFHYPHFVCKNGRSCAHMNFDKPSTCLVFWVFFCQCSTACLQHFSCHITTVEITSFPSHCILQLWCWNVGILPHPESDHQGQCCQHRLASAVPVFREDLFLCLTCRPSAYIAEDHQLTAQSWTAWLPRS